MDKPKIGKTANEKYCMDYSIRLPSFIFYAISYLYKRKKLFLNMMSLDT